MPGITSDIRNDANDGHQLFEKLYLEVRKAERRLYSDEEVKCLPEIKTGHLYSDEWKQRKESSARLIKYLYKKHKPLAILEIGCGNGWFSAQMAKNDSWKITGIDINKEELIQAARVFGKIPNLEFIHADIRSGQLKQNNFDVIVFASSIQYFPFIREIVKTAFLFLKTGGEIHILDTAFYHSGELEAARQRTKDYFTGIGFPEAASYYFHHDRKDLEGFNTKILYNPESWINKLGTNKNPFYWICIKKEDLQQRT